LPTHIEKDGALEGLARPHPSIVPLGHHIGLGCRRLGHIQLVTDTSGSLFLALAISELAARSGPLRVRRLTLTVGRRYSCWRNASGSHRWLIGHQELVLLIGMLLLLLGG